MNDRALFEAARSFASFARELSSQPDLEGTRQRVVDMGVRLLGCSAVALLRVGPTGRLSAIATSDERLVAADIDVANRTQSGPALDAARHRAIVVSNDLRTEPRWPAYSELLVIETQIRSAIAYPLTLDGTELGLLIGYSVDADYFNGAVAELGLIYVDHAAIALALSATTARVEHLEVALASNRDIGAAIGIIMARRHLDNEAAFDLIRQASQHRNVKLRDLAREILVDGDLPRL